ncbi:uncharacterized protein LOC134271813 [Saccostrea cucullata]|uniref:uncharacterized protein LOC134271813 n=1 Tax=Saccostrea cuccullata TaxID=36930 RepID=UPI002ED27CDF
MVPSISSLSLSQEPANFSEVDDYSDESDSEDKEESDDLYIPTDGSDLEADDDEDGEGEVQATTVKLRQDVSPVEEKQFLVSETALAELLSVCRYCSAECTPIIKFVRGTFIYTSSKCLNNHEFTWSSQPCHNTLPWSNLFTATAILTSGCNATKVLQLFNNMNLQMFTPRTYNRLQSYYVVPSATRTWDFEQSELLQAIRHGPSQDVVVGGDARCDSPGYSAKYGTYTIMDLERNKILDFQLVQSNEVKGSSHMELAGLKRAMGFLKDHVNITTLVTDRHSMVKKHMRIFHADKNHYFDVWHIAKGVSKKLEAASKKVNGHQIRPWIKSIANHCHWTASSCDDDGELKQAKWKSIVNHIANQHENHSQQYPRCEHAPIEDGRQWIKEGSVPHKLMKDIILSPFLLKDIAKLSPTHQTYSLKMFHSVVNHYAPKSTHFYYPAMLARLSVAALHFNENSSRQQAMTKAGELQYAVSYPKAKKGLEAVVKPKKIPPTFNYVTLIKQAVHERRSVECPSYRWAADDIAVLNQDVPLPLTQNFEHFEKAALIRRHASRFIRT